MSSKTVPAKTILVCDRCNGEGERGEGPFANGGTHAKKVETWGRGHDGSAGGISKDIDLCNGCSELFNHFLKGNFIDAIRSK